MEVLFKGYFDLDRLKEQVQKNKIEFEINLSFFPLFSPQNEKKKHSKRFKGGQRYPQRGLGKKEGEVEKAKKRRKMGGKEDLGLALHVGEEEKAAEEEEGKET